MSLSYVLLFKPRGVQSFLVKKLMASGIYVCLPAASILNAF